MWINKWQNILFKLAKDTNWQFTDEEIEIITLTTITIANIQWAISISTLQLLCHEILITTLWGRAVK